MGSLKHLVRACLSLFSHFFFVNFATSISPHSGSANYASVPHVLYMSTTHSRNVDTRDTTSIVLS